jgi:hypothetical protein
MNQPGPNRCELFDPAFFDQLRDAQRAASDLILPERRTKPRRAIDVTRLLDEQQAEARTNETTFLTIPGSREGRRVLGRPIRRAIFHRE